MHLPLSSRRLMCVLVALGCVAAATLAGCKATPDTDAAKPDGAKAETESPDTNKPGQDSAPNNDGKADDGKADATRPPKCAEFADKVCAAIGAQSGTCRSAQEMAGLLAPQACAAAVENFAYTDTQLKAMGESCTQLIGKLCKDLGEETATCKMVKERTGSFPPDRCKMMLDHYADVLKELEQQEALNKPLPADKQAAIAAADAPSFGPKDAKVTLVEFSDFQCPYCSMAANVTGELKKKYGDQVRVVFRHFPLSFHKEAHLAAQASMAAHKEGKFWEYHDKLFANQKELKRESLEQYAKDLKLDMAAFTKALDDKTYAKHVDDDFALGQSVTVQGTPTLFLNGERVSNPNDLKAVSMMIDTALGK